MGTQVTHPGRFRAEVPARPQIGSWGALYTEGWDRQVRYVRDEAKNIKREINQVWIYPPAADREALFAVANPDYVIVP